MPSAVMRIGATSRMMLKTWRVRRAGRTKRRRFASHRSTRLLLIRVVLRSQKERIEEKELQLRTDGREEAPDFLVREAADLDGQQLSPRVRPSPPPAVPSPPLPLRKFSPNPILAVPCAAGEEAEAGV